MISIITLGIIVGTAFLIKNANTNISVLNYVLVLIAGIVTFLFEPLAHTLINPNESGGAIQIASTFFGIYCVGWAVFKLIKFKKVKK